MMFPASVLRDGVVWYSGNSSRRFLGVILPDLGALLFIVVANNVALCLVTWAGRMNSSVWMKEEIAIEREAWGTRQRYIARGFLWIPEAMDWRTISSIRSWPRNNVAVL